MIGAILSNPRWRLLVLVSSAALTGILIYTGAAYLSSGSSNMPLSVQGSDPSPDGVVSPPAAAEKKDQGQSRSEDLVAAEYGTTARPALKGLANVVANLPTELVPRAWPLENDFTTAAASKRRLVIVGDVHGQKSVLENLLEKVSFDGETDHLVLVGDLVNKGPDSAGVVALAMSLGASAVRGNHEDRVLLAHAAAQSRRPPEGPAVDTTARGRRHHKDGHATADPGRSARGDEGDLATAASLTAAQLSWLSALPVVLRLGPLPGVASGDVLVVHGGLVPGVPLDRQDPHAAMTMRSLVYPVDDLRRDRVRADLVADANARAHGRQVHIMPSQVEAGLRKVKKKLAAKAAKAAGDESHSLKDVALPVSSHDGEPWADAWNRHQKALPPERRAAVVYGHDAKRGLSVLYGETYTFGLDSGCGNGKKLSAMVIRAVRQPGEGGRRGERFEWDIVQVDCPKVAPAKENDRD